MTYEKVIIDYIGIIRINQVNVAHFFPSIKIRSCNVLFNELLKLVYACRLS